MQHSLRPVMNTGAPGAPPTSGRRPGLGAWGLVLCLLTALLLAGAGPAQAKQRAAWRGIQIVTPQKKTVRLYRDYRALVVGIGSYQHWPDLPHAVSDAKKMGQVLTKLGFKTQVVSNPTSAQLLKLLRRLPYGLGAKKDRALLIYFAGHGATETLADGNKLGFVVPRDCPLPQRDPAGFAERAISMKQFEILALQIKSRHVLFAFDSCFSGSLFSMSRNAPTYISEKIARPVRQFITAGGENEQVPDQSIFRQVFIDGITGEADYDQDHYVTGSELGMYLQKQVVNYTRGAQHPQFGKIRNPHLDKGDFVFVLAKAGSARRDQPAKARQPGPQRAVASRNGGQRIKNALGMSFVKIQPAGFVMGFPVPATRSRGRGKEPPPGFKDAAPPHRVRITRPFFMQTTEVTQGQWKRVMGDNPSHFKGAANLPVDSVSWSQAQEFIRRLNRKDQKLSYRLPHEAEWELACRAGRQLPYGTGKSITPDQAMYQGSLVRTKKGSFQRRPAPVASFAPNPWGLYDLHGNLSEWCQDWYGRDYYRGSPSRDPRGPSRGQERVLRGGSWNSPARGLRCSMRLSGPPGLKSPKVGLRLVARPKSAGEK